MSEGASIARCRIKSRAPSTNSSSLSNKITHSPVACSMPVFLVRLETTVDIMLNEPDRRMIYLTDHRGRCIG